jgi:hypothetical protein
VRHVCWGDLGEPYAERAVVGDRTAEGCVDVQSCGGDFEAEARHIVERNVALTALRTFVTSAAADETLTWEDVGR